MKNRQISGVRREALGGKDWKAEGGGRTAEVEKGREGRR